MINVKCVFKVRITVRSKTNRTSKYAMFLYEFFESNRKIKKKKKMRENIYDTFSLVCGKRKFCIKIAVPKLCLSFEKILPFHFVVNFIFCSNVFCSIVYQVLYLTFMYESNCKLILSSFCLVSFRLVF